MAAPINLGGELDTRVTAANIQATDSLRPVDFVCGEGEQVNIQLIHIQRDFPVGLDGITVEQDASLPADRTNFFHGLHDPDFIVGSHDRD